VLQNGKWVELEPEKEYSVLTNAYIAQKGGDGYFWFAKYGTDFQNTYATIASIIAEELNEHQELTPKEKDGRLQIIY
ncbi:MAG TPA: hypothetical protein ENK94_04625, partial [Campylobacterales bacterium]|nr:hypothetical protein [Campylobacterales bacterium]